uniref:Putative piggybac transposable element-derived n=1 Tax=Ixodes ricinus TaxID=34613 RepID=A0A6B0V2D9_IXORI
MTAILIGTSAPPIGRESCEFTRNEPSKWGYKAWTLVGRSGYVYRLYLYGNNLVRDAPNTQENIGESRKFTLWLTQDCPPGSRVFFDNFFASVELLIEMKKRQLGVTATFRVARTGNCPLKGEKTLNKEGIGAMDFSTEKDSRVGICSWNDNRSVTFVSNVHSVELLDTCTRYERKTKTYVNVERPNLVRVYNESMGGVEKVDMLLSFYRNDLKIKK